MLDRMPQIVRVMTPFPYAIGIDESAASAKALMQEHGFRHLPVHDGSELVSVLSRTDLPDQHGPPASQSDLQVQDICALDAYIVDVAEPLDEVLRTMADRHIDCTLVVKNGKLVGIFTATDACRCFGDFLCSRFPPPTGDDVA